MKMIQNKIYPLLLFIITLGLLVFASCTSNSTDPDIEEPDPAIEETTITLDNAGSNAYVVSSIEGEGASASLNQNNSAIQLKIGNRFTFINDGGASSHPLDFRNSESEKLLGQSNGSGIFDDNDEVDVRRNGDAISFTLTNELAAAFGDYICSFHPGMSASIMVMD